MDDKLIQLLAAINNLPARHRDALRRLVTPAIEEARSQNPSSALVETQCAVAFAHGFEAAITAMDKHWCESAHSMGVARQSATSALRGATSKTMRAHRAGITDVCDAGCLAANSAISDTLNASK